LLARPVSGVTRSCGGKCEKLRLAIDSVVGELVGDEGYLKPKNHPPRWG